MIKQEYLLKQARKAFVANPLVSLQDIAAAAGVGRATVYRHYASRDALLERLAMDAMDEVEEVVEGVFSTTSVPRERLAGIVRELARIGDAYYFTALASAFIANPKVRARYEGQLRELKQLVEQVQQTGGMTFALPAAWLVHVVDALIYAAWASVDSGDVARNDAAAFAVETFWPGVEGGAMGKPDHATKRQLERVVV